MFGFRLDGELLQASANRLLERAGIPLLREVVAVGRRSLAGTIVSPARVRFSCMEDDGQARKGSGGRIIPYLEVLGSDSPIQRSRFEAWDFVDVWIAPGRRIVRFVNAESGLMLWMNVRSDGWMEPRHAPGQAAHCMRIGEWGWAKERRRGSVARAPLGGIAVEAGLSGKVTYMLLVVDIGVEVMRSDGRCHWR